MGRRRKQTIGGDYGKTIEELFNKYNVNKETAYNPCTVVKILLADDDILSNLALRKMIEEDGQYQVFAFYNGVDVGQDGVTSHRPQTSTKNVATKSASSSSIMRCPNEGAPKPRPGSATTKN